MVQMPQLTYLYSVNDFQRFFEHLYKRNWNSSYNQTKLTQYEIGLKQQVGDVIDMGVTAFYKESTDLIGAGRVFASATVPVPFVTYENIDFAITKRIRFLFKYEKNE